MEIIVQMRFGAHLYGTATAESDLDLKAVYLPEARDILLQRVRPSITETRPRPPGEKNTAADVDFEAYSLQRYMELLAEGQSVAIDMLFAPGSAFITDPSEIWREIQELRGQFLSTRATAFVRYCRQQANRFGIKGSRVAAARKALELFEQGEARLGTTAKVLEVAAEATALADANEHLAIVGLPMPNGGTAPHFEVCDKKIAFTASLKTAREVVQRLVGEYGSRALQAERNEGVDWKALSHAVRVGREAIELYETGGIVFPLSCADHLRRIKQGAVPYQAVAAEIEALLEKVEAAAARSRLPREPRLDIMEELVASAYLQRVFEKRPRS
jgi:hypothetical protein